MVCVKIVIPSQLHPHIRMLPNYPAILIVLYCSLLFYCPYYTKVITIKIPKYLADCFLLLPNWGVSFYFGNLLQLTCFLLLPYWGIFLIFRFLLQLTCFLLLFDWGFFLYFENLLQPTCFLLLFHWGSSPHFQVFAPTSLRPVPILYIRTFRTS